MGTFHVEITDFHTDPSPELAKISSREPEAGPYVWAAYNLAKQLWGGAAAPPRIALSGGVLPLADGGTSVAFTMSAYFGPSGELSYRDNLVKLMKAGPDADGLCTRRQPGGGKCTKPFAHTDDCHVLGGST